MSSDAGAQWHFTAVAGADDVEGIACTSGSHCVAVGRNDQGDGGIFVTEDGGRKWSSAALPDDVEFVSNVACPDVSSCIAVGAAGNFPLGAETGDADAVVFRSSDGGRTWTELAAAAKAMPASVGTVFPVECTNATDCMIANIGAAGAVKGRSLYTSPGIYTSDGGAHWQKDLVRKGSAAKDWDVVTGLTCASAGPCAAVGTLSVYGDPAAVFTAPAPGGPWSLALWADASGPNWLGLPEGVACLTSTTCVVVGEGGPFQGAAFVARNWATYQEAALPPGSGALAAVACPSSSFCLAVGSTTSGGVEVLRTSNGTDWVAA
jgi:hypothetical protein